VDGDSPRQADAVIAAIEASAVRIRRDEVDRAVRHLNEGDWLTAAQRTAIHAVADGIADRLLAAPVESLGKGAGNDGGTVATARRVFDPKVRMGDDGGQSPRVPGMNDDA
jgi:glutamyl-tRNA reductase